MFYFIDKATKILFFATILVVAQLIISFDVLCHQSMRVRTLNFGDECLKKKQTKCFLLSFSYISF